MRTRWKDYLRNKLLRSRGGAHFRPRIQSIIEKLDDTEAEALYRLIEGIQSDAREEGKRKAQRHPFRR